jgi:hypothetical protein
MGTGVLSPSSAEDENERRFTSTPPIRRQGVDRGHFAFELNDLLFESMDCFLEVNITSCSEEIPFHCDAPEISLPYSQHLATYHCPEMD